MGPVKLATLRVSPANKAGTKRSGEQIGHNVPLCDKDGLPLSPWGLGEAAGVQGAVDNKRRVRLGGSRGTLVLPKTFDPAGRFPLRASGFSERATRAMWLLTLTPRKGLPELGPCCALR